ncbi:MAG TPA: transposase [Bryobacteraceae bacterium]|jgi:putative transposase
MGRIARVVIPDCWHHVTQRGNHQQTIFFSDSDRTFYLRLLRQNCDRYRVRIAGYCLMNNHIHLAAAPATEAGLARAIGRTHNDYARWLNLRRDVAGHLWQNRYFSCPMDEAHQWEALRYIELNPVRAGLVGRAADWQWSSARAHVSGRDSSGLLDWAEWRVRWSPETWGDALALGFDNAALLDRIREATRTGRPAGSPEFTRHLEALSGRELAKRTRGPKPKLRAPTGQLNFEVV